MGLTVVTLNEQVSLGKWKAQRGQMTLSSAYSTNGDSVSVNDFLLYDLKIILHDFSRDGFHFSYDYTNNRMQAFSGNNGQEMAQGTDLSGTVLRFVALGQ